MKNSLKFIIAALLFTGIFSCERKDTDPVLILQSPPAITNPASGTLLMLNKAEENNPFTFTWTAADFNLKNLARTTYKLQIDLQGNNFASPVTLVATNNLNYETTVRRVNNVLLGLGMMPEMQGGVEMRLIYDIDNAFIDTTSAVSINVIPYSDEIDVKPIYLLGSGTTIGWDNMAALEMTPLEDGKFEIVTTLIAGSDRYIKFISVLGQWAPQWGTDATGTWQSGPLVYRPDETVADPPAIPAPDFDSQFKIIADTVNLTYQVFEYGDIYLLGGATTVGWDNTLALPFIKVSEGKYTITTTLDPAGQFWKIIDERGAWAPQWGTDANGTPQSGNLVYRPDETVADPPAIPAPTTAGLYKIDVDIVGLTYTVTPQ